MPQTPPAKAAGLSVLRPSRVETPMRHLLKGERRARLLIRHEAHSNQAFSKDQSKDTVDHLSVAEGIVLHGMSVLWPTHDASIVPSITVIIAPVPDQWSAHLIWFSRHAVPVRSIAFEGFQSRGGEDAVGHILWFLKVLDSE